MIDPNGHFLCGGLLKPTSVHVPTTRILGKGYGVKVDERTLHNAQRDRYRFDSHNTKVYGQHHPEGCIASNET
jgi:hypothetical protein